MIGEIFNIDKIPFLITSNGRNYNGGNFNNVVGEFHDRIPILLPISRHSSPFPIIERVVQYRTYIKENNLNFSNFLVKGYAGEINYSRLISPFSFNSLIGSFEHFKREDEDEIRRKSMKQRTTGTLFQLGLIENLQANKLWVSYYQNSGFGKEKIKKLFMKTYADIVNGPGFQE